MKARLSEGAALVSYPGHGSVASWQLDLLTTEDVPGLTNGSRLPLVIALNCFNGFFQSLFPEESLAEALVRAPNGGAVGVWASSGMTSPQWQWRMNLELYRQIFQGGWRTIGEAMRAAKQVVGDPDVRRTWIYFGDPVTRFAGPLGLSGQVTAVDAPALTSQRPGVAGAAGGGSTTPSQRRTELPASLAAAGDLSYASGQWSVAGEPIAVDLWRSGYRIATGDFDGDGRSEIFALSPETGAWFQAVPDGDGGFTYRSGGILHDGQLLVADFNGDARDDLLVYDTLTGRWTLMLSGAGGSTHLLMGGRRP